MIWHKASSLMSQFDIGKSKAYELAKNFREFVDNNPRYFGNYHTYIGGDGEDYLYCEPTIEFFMVHRKELQRGYKIKFDPENIRAMYGGIVTNEKIA